MTSSTNGVGRIGDAELAAQWTQDANVVEAVEQFIRAYCVLPAAAYLPLAIWCIATFLPLVFDCFAYLALLSPAKRCGKTRALEVLELLCARPWRGTAPTPAALFRIMSDCPTLLLDEIEGLRSGKNSSESQLAVLAVLNAGHRRGATVPRCAGKDQHLEFHPVYGPKVFAAIGRLPDTISDRAICIDMQRKTSAQKVERFLFTRAAAAAKPIRAAVARWASDNEKNVRIAYESLPDLTWLSDRDADLWSPLFSAASVAIPGRMPELRSAALVLATAKSADDLASSLPIRLLSDIRSVWPEGSAHISSASLVEKLREVDESPWREYETNARKVAKWLRPFSVLTRKVRIGSITVQGYLRSEFDDAFARYVTDDSSLSGTSGTTRVNTGENHTFRSGT